MFSLKSWKLLMVIENFSAILHIESEALKILGSYIQYQIQYITLSIMMFLSWRIWFNIKTNHRE
jgi:hypothetical protein